MSVVEETLVDVRTPEEFAQGHARGAINIPVQELGARLGELSRVKRVVVYCRSGARSATAARLLRMAGFTVEDCSTLAGAQARNAGRLAALG